VNHAVLRRSLPHVSSTLGMFAVADHVDFSSFISTLFGIASASFKLKDLESPHMTMSNVLIIHTSTIVGQVI
jgi:hypothetical protein